MRARDYIVDYLTLRTFLSPIIFNQNTDPGTGFTADQVIYHKFDWTDTTVETKGNTEEVVTTTWSGVNILAWTNTSILEEGQKVTEISKKFLIF
jgi:hypothetical protein